MTDQNLTIRQYKIHSEAHPSYKPRIVASTNAAVAKQLYLDSLPVTHTVKWTDLVAIPLHKEENTAVPKQHF